MCSSNSYGYGDNGESLSLQFVIKISESLVFFNDERVRRLWKVGSSLALQRSIAFCEEKLSYVVTAKLSKQLSKIYQKSKVVFSLGLQLFQTWVCLNRIRLYLNEVLLLKQL